MEAWKIVKDRTKCERPGCPLRAAGDYFAVLELPSCQRRDLCEPCFREEEARGGERPLFWRGRRREGSRAGPVLDLASLRMLFDRLGEPQSPERAEIARGLRYMVALLLLRKRWLKMVDARTAEEESADLVVVDPKIEGMEPVALYAPASESAQLGSLQDELMAVLGDGEAGSA